MRLQRLGKEEVHGRWINKSFDAMASREKGTERGALRKREQERGRVALASRCRRLNRLSPSESSLSFRGSLQSSDHDHHVFLGRALQTSRQNPWNHECDPNSSWGEFR